MTFAIGNIATFSFNGSDVSQYVKSVEFTGKRDAKKLPRLGSFATAKLPGPRDDSMKVEGWNDPVLTDLVFSAYAASPQVAVAVSFTLQSGQAVTGNVYVTNATAGADSEDPQTCNFDLEADEDGLTYS